MSKKMRQIIKNFIPNSIIEARQNKRINEQIEINYSEWRIKIYKEWEKSGFSNPPPHAVKQKVIEEYQKKHKCYYFVETGTFMGDMIEAHKRSFEQLYTIELSNELFLKATKRFENDKNVSVYSGDSGKVLYLVLNKIKSSAIFWLDGHYSEGITAKGDKECPIFEELNSIFSSKKLNHILLIDDARCFVGVGDYPTIIELEQYVKSKDNRYKMKVENDIIRFTVH